MSLPTPALPEPGDEQERVEERLGVPIPVVLDTTQQAVTDGESPAESPGHIVSPSPTPHRELRARARESNPETPVTERNPGGIARRLWEWARVTVQPPELWSDGRPPLRETWAYATRGEWTGPETPGRGLGRIYAALIALPLQMVLRIFDWIVERPSRLALALLLVVLLRLTDPGHVALGIPAGAARWLLAFLT